MKIMTVGKYIINPLFEVVNVVPAVFLFSTKGVKVLEDTAKQARNEYMKRWRAKNKDKVKASQERYWNKKALSTDKSNK